MKYTINESKKKEAYSYEPHADENPNEKELFEIGGVGIIDPMYDDTMRTKFGIMDSLKEYVTDDLSEEEKFERVKKIVDFFNAHHK